MTSKMRHRREREEGGSEEHQPTRLARKRARPKFRPTERPIKRREGWLAKNRFEEIYSSHGQEKKPGPVFKILSGAEM